MALTLYGFWRSTAAYRVRIVLALKRCAYEAIPIDLRSGQQSEATFCAVNPQGFVPFLIDDVGGVGQSLAIIEYLDECYPDPPLLPPGPMARARARSLAQVVACDIHPLNNLRVLKYLASLGWNQGQINQWARRWIEPGFAAIERQADVSCSRYLACDTVSIADVCLVPQLYNARRVETDLTLYPRILEIEARLMNMPEFANARPELQSDAVPV